MNKLWSWCVESEWGFSALGFWGALFVWTLTIVAAIITKSALNLSWSDPLPFLVAALAPVFAAIAMKFWGNSGWSLVFAALVYSASLWVAAVFVVKDLEHGAFDVGIGTSFLIIFLGVWGRDKSAWYTRRYPK